MKLFDKRGDETLGEKSRSKKALLPKFKKVFPKIRELVVYENLLNPI